MKPRNITPVVRVGAILMWIAVVANVTTATLPTALALGVGAVLGVLGGIVIIRALEGDRIWLKSGGWLPVTLMLKPRGYDMTSTLKGANDDGGRDIECVSCGNNFEVTHDHFRSDSDHYCPDCSRIGEVVMKNYHEWFDTTDDVSKATN